MAASTVISVPRSPEEAGKQQIPSLHRHPVETFSVCGTKPRRRRVMRAAAEAA
jgi:hypothetical protein